MKQIVRPALTLLIFFSTLVGLMYPMLMTGISQVVFPFEANGSIMRINGKVLGSALIGQPFAAASYFWSRPSATTTMPYDASASNGSNLGPSNPALRETVEYRINALKAADPENTAPIPVDLVTSSGSGLDPHLSPAGVLYQVGRIARERHLPEATVRRLVEQCTEERTLGILGEPRVNVLRLNLALDDLEKNSYKE
jgi:K+-transporting ATPase ATPase C chain